MPEPIKPYQEFVDKNYNPNSKLDWRPESWLGERAESVTGPKYTEEDVRIFRSHVPEYKKIEREARKNGTWLQMTDGTTWTGDPREWVMMQSEAFKKNYQDNPWYTGQAEWATKVTLPNGTVVDTDKVKRARYHNGEMWFSNDAGYAQYFADIIDSSKLSERYHAGSYWDDTIDSRVAPESKIKGKVFLAGIPKTGNYRHLDQNHTSDYWQDMPYDLTENDIVRTSSENIQNTNDYRRGNIKISGENLKTDDLVNHSRQLGDDGLFIYNVNDGPALRKDNEKRDYKPIYTNEYPWGEDGNNARPAYIPINEFISQPGFTEKIKFIRGNNGNFDPNTDDKYSAIFKTDSPLFAQNGGILKAQNGTNMYPVYGSQQKAKFAYDAGSRNPEAIGALFDGYKPSQAIGKSHSYMNGENDNFQSYFKTTGNNNLGIEQKLGRVNGNETDVTTFFLPNGDTYSENHIDGTSQYNVDYAKRLGMDKLPKPKTLFENGGILKAQEGTTISSERVPTLEEYIQSKQQEARQKALANSYNAVKPRPAKKYYTEQDLAHLQLKWEDAEGWVDWTKERIEEAEKELNHPLAPKNLFIFNPKYKYDYDVTDLNHSGEILLNDLTSNRRHIVSYEEAAKTLRDRLDSVNKYGYDWTGDNCVTNATGWYGDPYVCAGNIDFKKDPSKYGFAEINADDALPGDIFQYDENDGRPYHATMYAKRGDYGTYYTNYANGDYLRDIVHDSTYWGKGKRAFRFVGLPKDIETWTREYNELYSKKFGGILDKFKKGGKL